MSNLTIEKQVEIMEKQIHSQEANFTLMEKMQYLVEYFGNDPMFSREAADIVRSNICRNMKPESNRPVCTHNEMVHTEDSIHVWKCADCGHVYGT